MTDKQHNPDTSQPTRPERTERIEKSIDHQKTNRPAPWPTVPKDVIDNVRKPNPPVDKKD